MQSEVVNLHILGGVKQGIISARVPNWSGKVYTVPMGKIDLLDDEVKSGVYIFIDGSNIRIGWAINWLNNETLTERVKKEEDSTTGGKVILLTTTDEYFLEPKTVVALVNKLEQGMSASKYEVETTAQKVEVETDVVSQVDSFIRKVKVILNAQGYDLFDETEVDTQPEIPKVVEDARPQLVDKTEDASKHEEVIVESKKKEVVGDKSKVTQKSKGINYKELANNYEAKVYLYGDLLTLDNHWVEAKGRLYKDKFTLLKDTHIKGKVSKVDGVNPVTGKLFSDIEFTSVESAMHYLMGDKNSSKYVWRTLNGTSFDTINVVDIPEGPRSAKYKNDEEGIDAEGYILPGGYFILKEGAMVATRVANYSVLPDAVITTKGVIENGYKVDSDTSMTLDNIIFDSVAVAAKFVTLKNKNGWDTWVDEEGNKFSKAI